MAFNASMWGLQQGAGQNGRRRSARRDRGRFGFGAESCRVLLRAAMAAARTTAYNADEMRRIGENVASISTRAGKRVVCKCTSRAAAESRRAALLARPAHAVPKAAAVAAAPDAVAAPAAVAAPPAATAALALLRVAVQKGEVSVPAALARHQAQHARMQDQRCACRTGHARLTGQQTWPHAPLEHQNPGSQQLLPHATAPERQHVLPLRHVCARAGGGGHQAVIGQGTHERAARPRASFCAQPNMRVWNGGMHRARPPRAPRRCRSSCRRSRTTRWGTAGRWGTSAGPAARTCGARAGVLCVVCARARCGRGELRACAGQRQRPPGGQRARARRGASRLAQARLARGAADGAARGRAALAAEAVVRAELVGPAHGAVARARPRRGALAVGQAHGRREVAAAAAAQHRAARAAGGAAEALLLGAAHALPARRRAARHALAVDAGRRRRVTARAAAAARGALGAGGTARA